ncbi:TPA: hypothetical protein QDC03_007089 [Burkholderia cepacia]|uniref:hypothetical protein n=1 Tax=Burkholderia cepacia TaxID=292 RepID=UPI0011B1C8A8|nr:hypothetical protein [Burkholderia cepacia]HDR9511853.1 hypothetical protein [Burkholderia cepacia]
MSDVHTRVDLARMLWNFNVNVVDNAHPGWLKHAGYIVGAGRSPSMSARSKQLIAQHQLAFVPADLLSDVLGRIVFLDALDLHRLARWGAVLAACEEVRLCVFGGEIRHCIRILGRRLLERGITFDRTFDSKPFDQVWKQCQANRLPQRLVEIQRRLLRAMCDGQSPAAAQRMRLRFRPEYFDRVAPLDGAGPVIKVLFDTHEHADLSERAKCILAS